MKGQGSTEYLVILAVVLVVALIVIGLLGGFTGFGVSGQEQQSQAYWKGVSPFSIQNALVTNSGGGVDLEIQNRDTKRLILTAVDFGTGNKTYLAENFAAGQTKLINTLTNATSDFGCAASGDSYVIEQITFTYSSGSGSTAITGITQTGDKSLQGKCV